MRLDSPKRLNSENDHENNPSHHLPVRTRLGVTGGSQRMHQGRHRRRRRRPCGGPRQAWRRGGMRDRTSRSQQAEPEQLERPGSLGAEVERAPGPRREDQITFREPHRRARRWLALANIPWRSRSDAELEARDGHRRHAG